MNAAAKAINQSSLFHGELTKMKFTYPVFLQTVLMLMVLASAIMVVYVINLQRVTLDQLQLAEQQGHQLEVRWGQLLLEQASLATPGRVEQMAKVKLHMHLPFKNQSFVFNTR